MARRRLGQSRVPIRCECTKLFAQGNQLLDSAIEIVQPFLEQRAHFSTRRAAAIALSQHLDQVTEREAHHQRALNQVHARSRCRWVASIARRRPPCTRQQPQPLVVTECVRADARLAGEVARPEQSIAHFTRFDTAVESPVL